MNDSITRRVLMGQGAAGLGSLALPRLLDDGARPKPHFAPKAKRLVYLFHSGGPSQLETFDYKPVLQQRNGEELPDSVRGGQRLTAMSGNQSSLPLAGAPAMITPSGIPMDDGPRQRRSESHGCRRVFNCFFSFFGEFPCDFAAYFA